MFFLYTESNLPCMITREVGQSAKAADCYLKHVRSLGEAAEVCVCFCLLHAIHCLLPRPSTSRSRCAFADGKLSSHNRFCILLVHYLSAVGGCRDGGRVVVPSQLP